MSLSKADQLMVSNFLHAGCIDSYCTPMSGYTRLQASTNFACMGENITFSCTTSNFFLIWEVTFTDWTIRSITHLFQTSDSQGRLFSESTHGVHLYFQLVSNRNGALDSILRLVVYASSALLENAMIECDGTETRRLIFRLACKYM